jgi:hypothetical protein
LLNVSSENSGGIRFSRDEEMRVEAVVDALGSGDAARTSKNDGSKGSA